MNRKKKSKNYIILKKSNKKKRYFWLNMRFDNSLPCDIPQMDLLSVPNTQSVVESGSWFLIPAEADFQTGSVIFKI